MGSLGAMKVREADERDAEAVIRVWTDAYADVDPEGRREPYSLQEYYAVAAVADLRVVEDEAGAVVGVVAVFPPGAPGRSVAGPGEAELARLAVAAGARRHGIGRALVEGAAAQARAARRRADRALEPPLPDRRPPALRIARLPARPRSRRRGPRRTPLDLRPRPLTDSSPGLRAAG